MIEKSFLSLVLKKLSTLFLTKCPIEKTLCQTKRTKFYPISTKRSRYSLLQSEEREPKGSKKGLRTFVLIEKHPKRKTPSTVALVNKSNLLRLFVFFQ